MQPQEPKPTNVSAIKDGKWVDEEDPSKYFGKEVGFLPRWGAKAPMTPTPTLLLRGKQQRDEDEISAILDSINPNNVFSHLPPEVIEKIKQDKRVRSTHEFCMQFSNATEHINEFNPILNEFIAKMKAGALDLDYIPFNKSGCTSYVIAFVEHRCIQMAKRTYNLLLVPPNQYAVKQLQDLRTMMLMDFAIPRRDRNNAKLHSILGNGKEIEEGFIDEINCSIERTAKLCCTVLDTDVEPRGTFPDEIAFALLNDCCDQFLTIINIPNLRPDLKQKTVERLKLMMSWLHATANDGVQDQFESDVNQYYQKMKLKIQQTPELVRQFAGGTKSKNKSSRRRRTSKRKSNKNKNSRHKKNKNKKKTLRLRIKK